MADPPPTPPLTAEEIIRRIENRLDKYTHKVYSVGTTIEANEIKYEIEDVSFYGEYGDIYTVRSPTGTRHQMRTEVVRPPKAYQSFPTIACLMEEVNACKDPFMKKHFLVAENSKADKLFKYIFTPLIGPSMTDVRRYHVGTNFPIGDALNLAIQCYFTIEYLHLMGYVHGDLSPSSFSFGLFTLEHNVYLSHFGRLKKHVDGKTGLQVKKRSKLPYMGKELVFSPRSAHRRKDYGRGDDLESWLYISADLFDDSSLPWKPRRKRELLPEDDLLMKKEQFFAGNKALETQFFKFYPKELQKLPALICDMKFETKPNYDQFKYAFFYAKKRIGAPLAKKWQGLSLDLKKYPVPRRPINNYVKRKKKNPKTGLDTVSHSLEDDESTEGPAEEKKPKQNQKKKERNGKSTASCSGDVTSDGGPQKKKKRKKAVVEEENEEENEEPKKKGKKSPKDADGDEEASPEKKKKGKKSSATEDENDENPKGKKKPHNMSPNVEEAEENENQEKKPQKAKPFPKKVPGEKTIVDDQTTEEGEENEEKAKKKVAAAKKPKKLSERATTEDGSEGNKKKKGKGKGKGKGSPEDVDKDKDKDKHEKQKRKKKKQQDGAEEPEDEGTAETTGDSRESANNEEESRDNGHQEDRKEVKNAKKKKRKV